VREVIAWFERYRAREQAARLNAGAELELEHARSWPVRATTPLVGVV
jgi:hypothetical protein